MDKQSNKTFETPKAHRRIETSLAYLQAQETRFKLKLKHINKITLENARQHLANNNEYSNPLYLHIDKLFEAKHLETRDGEQVSHFKDTIRSYSKLEKTLSDMQLPPDSPLAALHNEMLNASAAIEGTQSTSSSTGDNSHRDQDDSSDTEDYISFSDSSDNEDYTYISNKSSKIERSSAYQQAQETLFKHKLKKIKSSTLTDVLDHMIKTGQYSDSYTFI